MKERQTDKQTDKILTRIKKWLRTHCWPFKKKL